MSHRLSSFGAFVACLAALLLAVPAAAQAAAPPACDVSFTGTDRVWSTAANWSTGEVPQASQDVCIPADKVVEAPAGTPAPQSLRIEGDFWVGEGTTLSPVDGLWLESGVLRMLGGDVEVPSRVHVNGGQTTGGTVRANGVEYGAGVTGGTTDVLLQGAAADNVSGDVPAGHTLRVAGIPSTPAVLDGAAAWTNRGTLVLGETNTGRANWGVTGGTLTNAGTLAVMTAAGTIGADVVNSGDISPGGGLRPVLTGALTLRGGTIGPITVQGSGALVYDNDGRGETSSDIVREGSGTISGGIGGAHQLRLRSVGATESVLTGSTFVFNSGLITLDASDEDAEAAFLAPLSNAGTVRTAGTPATPHRLGSYGAVNQGRIDVAGDAPLEVGGLLSLASGTLGGSYTLRDALVLPDGTALTALAGLLELEQGGGIKTAGGTDLLSGLTSVTSSGVLDLRTSFGVGGALTNAGQVLIPTGAGLSTSGDYTQTGSTALTEVLGVLQTGDNATGKADVQGGVLRGQGTVAGDLRNAALVRPGLPQGILWLPGTLAVSGDYTQTADGRLTGYTRGHLFNGDQALLSVGGTSSVAGTLELTEYAYGYTRPACLIARPLLSTGAISGTFAEREVPAASAAGAWLAYDEGDGVNEVRGFRFATKPDAPSNVQVDTSSGTPQVSWSTPGDGCAPLTGYRISARKASDPNGPEVAGMDVAPGATVPAGPSLPERNTAYVLTVTATNAVGSATSPGTQVQLNAAPLVSIETTPERPTAGSAVTLAADVSDDHDADSALTYAWDVDGDGFDDGTTAQITRTFATAGTKTVRVRVTDTDGLVGDDELDVVVRAKPAVQQPAGQQEQTGGRPQDQAQAPAPQPAAAPLPVVVRPLPTAAAPRAFLARTSATLAKALRRKRALVRGVDLTFTAPAAGTLKVEVLDGRSRRSFARSTKRVSGAGKAKLRLKASGSARALLRRPGRRKASLRVTFTPASGPAGATRTAVTLVG